MLAVLGAGEYRGEIDIIFIYSPEASSGVGRARGGTVGGMSSGSTRWLVDYLLVGRMEAEGCRCRDNVPPSTGTGIGGAMGLEEAGGEGRTEAASQLFARVM